MSDQERIRELEARVDALEQALQQTRECLRTGCVEAGEVRLIDPDGTDVGGLTFTADGRPALVLVSGDHHYVLGVTTAVGILGVDIMDDQGNRVFKFPAALDPEGPGNGELT